MIERISSQGNLLAIVIYDDRDDADYGVKFTELQYPLQVGIIKQPLGHIIPAHSHPPVVREIEGTCEVLVVTAGALRITLYDDERREVKRVGLLKGDAILLLAGGHEIECMGDPTRIVEVKQGPYAAGGDKVRWT